jgi:low temperature requirement protein LtrA
MTRFAATVNLLRPRGGGRGHAPVTQIELFFDLVFVFAVTQLSAELRTHLSILGVAHTLMLFAAVWWVWVYTSWVTNWLEPKHRPVQAMLIALMLFGLVLSTSLPQAFGARGLAFAISYVVMQFGRSLFMLWAVEAYDPANTRNFRRVCVWIGLSSLFWLAGGLTRGEPRTGLWLAALALDLISPSTGFYVPGLGHSTTADWTIDSDHLAERCAGFILIALGESITVTGETFYELHWDLSDAAAFLAALAGVVALWWIYFDKAAERTAEAFAQAKDPGRIARAAYTYVHGALVAGIIIVAAGDFLILHGPLTRAGPEAGLMVIGGPGLFLLGNGVFRRLVHPRFPPSHLYGLGLLAGVAVAAPVLPLLALAWAVALVLVFVIICGDRLLRQQEVQ